MIRDLRHLRPSDLVQLINTTSQGPALHELRLRRHRARAGLRIGDGRTVDLFRYLAWVSEMLATPVAAADPEKDYQAHRSAASKRRREMSDAGRDIGDLPAIVERHNHDEISAIQHAINLRLQDEAAFFAEYQNEPLPETTETGDDLSADQIAAKLNGLGRAEVPAGAQHLTAFNAQGPKKVQGDAGSVEQHSLSDQIAADRYLASKQAVRSKSKGIQISKLIPPGAA